MTQYPKMVIVEVTFKVALFLWTPIPTEDEGLDTFWLESVQDQLIDEGTIGSYVLDNATVAPVKEKSDEAD